MATPLENRRTARLDRTRSCALITPPSCAGVTARKAGAVTERHRSRLSTSISLAQLSTVPTRSCRRVTAPLEHRRTASRVRRRSRRSGLCGRLRSSRVRDRRAAAVSRSEDRGVRAGLMTQRSKRSRRGVDQGPCPPTGSGVGRSTTCTPSAPRRARPARAHRLAQRRSRAGVRGRARL